MKYWRNTANPIERITMRFIVHRITSIGFEGIGGVKSKETRSYQKGKCNSPIFSTFLGHVLDCYISLLIRSCFLAFYTTDCQILFTTNFHIENAVWYLFRITEIPVNIMYCCMMPVPILKHRFELEGISHVVSLVSFPDVKAF